MTVFDSSAKPKTHKPASSLSSRWGRSAKRNPGALGGALARSSHLPSPLPAEGIVRLIRQASDEEVEHLIGESSRHTATLKQLHERLQTLGSSSFEHELLQHDVLYGDNLEDFRHAFEHWRLRLAILEMIASARQSLRRLPVSERECVASARISTRGLSARTISTSSSS